MAILGKKIILCDLGSDAPSLTVSRASPNPTASVRVLLGVNDRDSDDSADGAPLITAQLTPSQAINLARNLLEAAGCNVDNRDSDGALVCTFHKL